MWFQPFCVCECAKCVPIFATQLSNCCVFTLKTFKENFVSFINNHLHVHEPVLHFTCISANTVITLFPIPNILMNFLDKGRAGHTVNT